MKETAESLGVDPNLISAIVEMKTNLAQIKGKVE